MAQLEGFFNVSGTGRFFPVTQKTDDMPLRGSQIHLRQRIGYGLVKLPVQNPYLVSVKIRQRDHLRDLNVARYLLF